MTTVAVTPVASDLTLPSRAKSSVRHRLRRVIRTRPLAVVSATYLMCVILLAAFAGAIAPYGPANQDLAHVLAAPSGAHWLGTDRLGRDILSRLLFGARATLLDVAVAFTVHLAIAVPLGMVAGYRGGWLDRLISRASDLLLALPGIVVLLMILAVFPGNDLAAMIALGVIGSPGLLRIARGATLSIRGQLYVKAARLSGLRTPAILGRHILPRIAAPVIVQSSLFCATALIAASGLSFLGLARPDTNGPTWGNMIAEASSVMSQDSWMLIPTGGLLGLTALAFVLVGDAVRDATVGKSMPTADLVGRRRPMPASPAQNRAVPRTAGDNPALMVDDLTVSMQRDDTEVTVLDGVSLAVGAGEIVGVVGESGCGKSMTAKAILGLLPPGGRIARGRVIFDHSDLARMSETDLIKVRGSGIALISQDPIGSLDPTFTIGSQLREVVRRHQHCSRKAANIEAQRLLHLVNLPNPAELMHQLPAELSGGMAQRVCIALALASKPKLLIADEPTTALDVTVQAEILGLLRSLRHQLGMAILLITHDWGVLADACDRALVMYAGEIVETATTDELYTTPKHPYTRALLAANPHLAHVGQDLPSIAGTVPKPGHWPSGCHYQTRCALAAEDCEAAPIPLIAINAHRRSRCIHIDQLDSR